MEKKLVEMKNICKSFPGVKALDGVFFDLKEGEVHALLGENGAGKSTLMKILSGIYRPDAGTFVVAGNIVENLTPKRAASLGIAIIHQELNMCRHLTVAENIFLGREEHSFGVIHQKKLDKKATEILARLNLSIAPTTVVGSLSISQQQMIEITKALSTNARILIMDEPTSALTEKETQELFSIINELKKQGYGIVYISHRLDELKHIADRVTILRDGKYICTQDYQDMTLDEIIASMVGRQIVEKFPRQNLKKGKKILEVKNLVKAPRVRDVSFELFEGEILGIAGLMGAGRTDLVRLIFGAEVAESGEIFLMDEKLNITSPAKAIQAGIVFAPEDRRAEGLCTDFSLLENVSLANLDSTSSRWGKMHKKQEIGLSMQAIKKLKIKASSYNQDVKNLSGGNQQKIVVGKWLVRNSKVVIFDEPTRGIDVAAKVEIYNLMNELKKNNLGVLFVSSEMPEVMGMSDRLLVMCNGKLTGNFNSRTVTQDEVLYAATRY